MCRHRICVSEVDNIVRTVAKARGWGFLFSSHDVRPASEIGLLPERAASDNVLRKVWH